MPEGVGHGVSLILVQDRQDRSHALRGNASMDALRPLLEHAASLDAFPRLALWNAERP
ncbi:hypothetical protein BN844_1875 [Pseudomonas sp. SHC52]|nr:hypothetical protein BN844_1875 [Pseudomonas sp. SHC52]